MPHPYFDVPRPVVIGHRGAAGTHPENTLASFAAALEQGAAILESDVQVTRDGVPVLLHDAEIDRVTEGHGRADAHDWATLRRLDAGHRFQPGGEDAPTDEDVGLPERGFPERGKSHRIPALEEAFEAFPDARFNLEIKCADPAAIRASLDLVERFERADRTLLTAGEDEVMRLLRAALAGHAAKPAIGASLSEIVAAISSALGAGPMPEGVMALQIPATFADRPLATPELVAHAAAHDVAVHVWTVNELAEIEALVEIGVDGIVTDFPGRMADWLARRDSA